VVAQKNFDAQAVPRKEMQILIAFWRLLMLTIALSAATLSYAAEDSDLERVFLLAMQPKLNQGDPGWDRLVPPGKAIQAYIRKGYLTLKPETRIEYTDYRMLRKKAYLLQQELVVIEEEYMSKWVGCCVSPGVGVIVRVVADTEDLAAFARKHKCSIKEQKDTKRSLEMLSLYKSSERYLGVSCRSMDYNLAPK